MPAVCLYMLSSFQLRSLKLRLLFPYALLIALLTAVIGGITYWAGASTVAALADRTLEQMAARLQQTIEHHVGGSAATLETVFPSGMPASPDIRQDWHNLRRRLWAATTLHPANNYVYYGNVAGQNIGMKRLDDGSAVVRVRRDGNAHREFYALPSIDAQGRYIASEKAIFDPRERPWFQKAAQTDSHVWTPVYIDFSLQDLVLTRARRVLNAQGSFEGVVATDVSLSHLGRVVDELGRSVEGFAFVVEPDGDLVAASNMKNIRLSAQGELDRVTVHSSGNEMMRRIYEQLQSHFHVNEPKHRPIEKVHSVHLRAPDGTPVHAAFVRVRDAAGLDWIAVVAVARTTILADVSKLVGWVLGIGTVSFLVALLIGMRLFGRVADDIHALSLAVQRVGQGDITTDFAIQRNDEVGELAHTFRHMRRELFTDRLTGVSNRSALQHVLNQWTSQLGSNATPFALLFIDLDQFKPLNDRWGHDNGDRALQEVSSRIRNHIRADDHVARLGGDEFVVLLRGIDNLTAAQAASEKLVELISAPLSTLQAVPADVIVRLGASVGIALYPHDTKNAQTLLKHADEHMYAQKANRPSAEQR